MELASLLINACGMLFQLVDVRRLSSSVVNTSPPTRPKDALWERDWGRGLASTVHEFHWLEESSEQEKHCEPARYTAGKYTPGVERKLEPRDRST